MFKAFKALAKIYKTLNVYAYLLFGKSWQMLVTAVKSLKFICFFIKI